MTQVLVLAHAFDAGAAAVTSRLQTMAGLTVRVVRPEVLSLARWSHRIDTRGQATTVMTLPGQESLSSADLGAALIRIRYLPVTRFRTSSAKDRDYASAELTALATSWLAGLGERAVHTVRHHPWVTPLLSLQRWSSVAAACGLPVAPRRISTSARWRLPTEQEAEQDDMAMQIPHCSVLVAGKQLAGSGVCQFGTQCLNAAQTLGFELLEFRFVQQAGGLVLTDVDTLPRLDHPAAVEATSRFIIARLQHSGNV